MSVLIQAKNKNIVIDTGPDFRQQMLRTGIRHLDAVVLTHEHNDHIIGIDDVRPFNFRQKEDIPVYALKRVQDDLKLRFGYAFSENKYPGAPSLSLRTISKDESFDIKGIQFTPNGGSLINNNNSLNSIEDVNYIFTIILSSTSIILNVAQLIKNSLEGVSLNLWD